MNFLTRMIKWRTSRKQGLELFDRFTSNAEPAEIIQAAHEIRSHFSSDRCEYPADVIGKVLRDLISPKRAGGEGTTLDWLILTLIVDTRNPYYFEYCDSVERFLDIGVVVGARREWVHKIVVQVHQNNPNLRPEKLESIIKRTA